MKYPYPLTVLKADTFRSILPFGNLLRRSIDAPIAKKNYASFESTVYHLHTRRNESRFCFYVSYLVRMINKQTDSISLRYKTRIELSVKQLNNIIQTYAAALCFQILQEAVLIKLFPICHFIFALFFYCQNTPF